MKDCCAKEEDIIALRDSHGRVLCTVLAINAVMFVVELVAGLMSHSTALLADSLDMLGDALVYAFSLFVLGKGLRWEARASTLKGWIMFAFGVGVLIEALYRLTEPVVPEAGAMGITGFAALVMNSICFALLWNHRDDNINMKSTWVCSRNDLIGNAGVILAGFLTGVTASQWPDIIIGTAIAAIFMRSALRVLSDARFAERSALPAASCEPACEEVATRVTLKVAGNDCDNCGDDCK